MRTLEVPTADHVHLVLRTKGEIESALACTTSGEVNVTVRCGEVTRPECIAWLSTRSFRIPVRRS